MKHEVDVIPVSSARSDSGRALNLEDLQKLAPTFERVGFAQCLARRCLLAWEGDEHTRTLHLVFAEDVDFKALAWFEPAIEAMAPRAVARSRASASAMMTWLQELEVSVRALDRVSTNRHEPAKPAGDALPLTLSGIESSANETVRLTDATLFDALRSGASDIHFEQESGGLSIKYRLDGVLQQVARVNGEGIGAQVISRLKVLAELDIAERRVPQDGRFRAVLESREIDFRVSVMPSLVGEDAVLRVLDRKHLTGGIERLTLDALGFSPLVADFVRRCARMPYGMLLVTGPTGSGKTTTLYAALSEIQTGLDKVVTIEDPIEYQLKGVLQIPVNERKGLTFARGLRSILRHDPDKIMVGEIRDSETADIAVQAALTGHQVFTTVHANNVFDVIGRFTNMQVDRYSLTAALTGIMAQRLVRRLCQACACPSEQSDKSRRCGAPALEIMQAIGCPNCRGTGYRGRLAISEVLPVNDELREAVVEGGTSSKLKSVARARGFKPLREAGLELVAQGLTTMAEVDRVAPGELA